MRKLLLLFVALSVVLLGQFHIDLTSGIEQFQFTSGQDNCHGRSQSYSCFDLAVTATLAPGYIFELKLDNPSNEPQYYRLWTSDSAHPMCLRVDYREFIADEPVIVPCDMGAK